MRFVFFILAWVTVCAFIQPASAIESAKYNESVLYSFCSQQNCADGAFPSASLTNVNGTLYGTTIAGGTYGPCGDESGCGVLFSVDPSTGAEKVLYSFCSQPNCTDGASPVGGLIDFKGLLYGTTLYGGGGFNGQNYGVVFALDPTTGAETVLHTFCSRQNCADGARSFAGLIAVKGTLYGTTFNGGGAGCNGYGCGTVFSIKPGTGKEKVLYAFCQQQNCTDGLYPDAPLIYVNGTLYGTTVGGGAYTSSCRDSGCGTVFSIDPDTGVETVLHSFGSGTDGKEPQASLTAVDGMLYGTTDEGGNPGCFGNFGCGIVFSVDQNTGSEKVLRAFCSQQNCTDGANPSALIDVKGTLYGATSAGGGTGCGGGGCGTVFSIDPGTGAETVLYSFCEQPNCADGSSPSGLIAANGALYGATGVGGAYGNGTVFVLKKRQALRSQ